MVHFAANKFWEHIILLLQLYQNRIIVFFQCYEELEKLAMKKPSFKVAADATKALSLSGRLSGAQLVEIWGGKEDNFADNVFQVVFAKFRFRYQLLLITQDQKIVKDLLALNKNTSVKANSVEAKRINQYGFLSGFFCGCNLSRRKDVRLEEAF